MSKQIRVYEPSNKHKNFGGILKNMFTDLRESTFLGWQLFYRDKRAEYKQSLLGIFWAIITPFFTAVVWVFLNGTGAVSIEGTRIPYPLFVFMGVTFWSIFTESVNAPLTESNLAKPILSKVNFPTEAILLSAYFKVAFNIIIKLVLISLFLLWYGILPSESFIWFLPLLCLFSIFGFSIGLVLTPIGMLYKDISRLIPIILSMLMYLTPIVYPVTRIPQVNHLLAFNPLTPLINSIRYSLTGMPIENPLYLMIISVASLVMLFLGWIFYRVSIPILVERM